MATSNNKNKTSIVLLLILFILSLLALIFTSISNKKEKNQLIVERDTAVSQLGQLRLQYDALLQQLHDLEMQNDSLNKKAVVDHNLIMSLKKKIANCLKNGATAKELKEARELIQQLQAKIAELEAEIERLKAENEALRRDKEELTGQNASLQVQVDTLTNTNVILKDKVEKALILMVGDVVAEGVRVRGGEEQVVNKRNKMSLLRVRFNILENRVVEDGSFDFYIAIQGPEGSILTEEGKEAGMLKLEDEREVRYTAKLTVDYTQGQRKAMRYDYRSANKFAPGVYRVMIYQKGLKVGEGMGNIKKGFWVF